MTTSRLPVSEQRDHPTETCAVLVNPSAGRGKCRAAVAEAIKLLGRAGHEVRVLEATTRDEALAGCHRAVAEGASALVVIGDGTAPGVQAVAGTGAPFGIIPAGTGNDCRRAGVDSRPGEGGGGCHGRCARGDRSFDCGHRPDGYHGWPAAVLGCSTRSSTNAPTRCAGRRGRCYDFAIRER
jgi:diacylglycerol kinase (ATP)